MTKYGCNISSVDFFGWLDNSSFGAGGIHILVTGQRLWDRIIMICGEIKIGLQILLWECRSLERQYMNEYKCMISGWMIQQSCQTLQTPLFSSQLKVQLQRLKVRASVSKGWSSWHPQLQKLQLLTSSSRGWKSWHSSSGVERKGCFLLSCLCFFGFLLLLARLYLQPNGRPALDLKIILFLTILTRGTLIRENFSFLGFNSSSYSYLHILPCTGPGTSPIVSLNFLGFSSFSHFLFLIFLFSIASAQPSNGRYFYFFYTIIALAPSSTFVKLIFLLSFFFFFLSFSFFFFFLSVSFFFFSSFLLFLIALVRLPIRWKHSRIHYND